MSHSDCADLIRKLQKMKDEDPGSFFEYSLDDFGVLECVFFATSWMVFRAKLLLQIVPCKNKIMYIVMQAINNN